MKALETRSLISALVPKSANVGTSISPVLSQLFNFIFLALRGLDFAVLVVLGI